MSLMTTAAQPCPAWREINFQTAENLKFAATQQLFKTYLEYLHSPVSPSIVKAWLLNSFQGELSPQGMPDGQGSAKMLDGLTYTGSFKGGLLHGQGTLAKEGSWSYTGTFSYNCIHGSGAYQWANGAFYNGQLYQGLPHGNGIMCSGEEDNCTYEGCWKHGLRHGQGKLVYGKDGVAMYEGWWVHDHKHGEGFQMYSSQSTYTGSWLQGKRHGKGRLVALCSSKPSPGLYQAELGKLTLVPVYVYEGDWIDDLPSGRGKSLWLWDKQQEISNQLANRYIGDYERGMRHGKGTFYYASGAMYKGAWIDNKKHGVGCYIDEDGTILSGYFLSGRYLHKNIEANMIPKEPLQSLLEGEENFDLVKERLSNVLKRQNSIIREVYYRYSCLKKGEGRIQETCTCDRVHAILLEQLWQLCYDAKIVQTGLGLAQIDFFLHATETSWDDSPSMHNPDRQFIFREFVEGLIKISKRKFENVICSPDVKVDKLINEHISPLLTKGAEENSSILLSVYSMKNVFDGYAPQLHNLFDGTLREIATSDETIRLRALDLFFQRYKPQWGLQRDRLLSNLVKGLYQSDFSFGDDGAQYLDNQINYIEFQCAIMIYATSLKDPGSNEEPIVLLNNLIKEAIIPNLSIDLEMLMNEELMPNLPSINTKGANGISTSKAPRSAPGSKRSTPREGKVAQGGKSAPQTPVKKKLG